MMLLIRKRESRKQKRPGWEQTNENNRVKNMRSMSFKIIQIPNSNSIQPSQTYRSQRNRYDKNIPYVQRLFGNCTLLFQSTLIHSTPHSRSHHKILTPTIAHASERVAGLTAVPATTVADRLVTVKLARLVLARVQQLAIESFLLHKSLPPLRLANRDVAAIIRKDDQEDNQAREQGEGGDSLTCKITNMSGLKIILVNSQTPARVSFEHSSRKGKHLQEIFKLHPWGSEKEQ